MGGYMRSIAQAACSKKGGFGVLRKVIKYRLPIGIVFVVLELLLVGWFFTNKLHQNTYFAILFFGFEAIVFAIVGYVSGYYIQMRRTQEWLDGVMDRINSTHEGVEYQIDLLNQSQGATVYPGPASANAGGGAVQVMISDSPEPQFIYPRGIESEEKFGIPTIILENNVSPLPTIHGEQNVVLGDLTQVATGTVTQFVSRDYVDKLIAQIREDFSLFAQPLNQNRKPGRPSYDDDLWAMNELQKGRKKSEVYKEWLERPGVKARALSTPDKSFDRIARNARTGRKQNPD